MALKKYPKEIATKIYDMIKNIKELESSSSKVLDMSPQEYAKVCMILLKTRLLY